MHGSYYDYEDFNKMLYVNKIKSAIIYLVETIIKIWLSLKITVNYSDIMTITTIFSLSV